MQELKIFRWCDDCHQDSGKLVEATERWHLVVELPDGRAMHPRSLDLCEPHAKPVRELRELLDKAGAKLSPKGRAPKETEESGQSMPTEPGVQSPPPPEPPKEEPPPGKRACPECGKPLARSGVNVHLFEVHGAKRIRQPKVCPDCGKPLPGAHSMVLHRGASHGYDYVAEIMATIKRKQ